jgi:hypothetical protein
MRVYLFSGPKGMEMNRWYEAQVREHILIPIIKEYRRELGHKPGVPSAGGIEPAWVMHGGIFYYGARLRL